MKGIFFQLTHSHPEQPFIDNYQTRPNWPEKIQKNFFNSCVLNLKAFVNKCRSELQAPLGC